MIPAATDTGISTPSNLGDPTLAPLEFRLAYFSSRTKPAKI